MVFNGLSGYLVDSTIFELDSIKNLQTFFLKNYLQQHTGFDGLLVGEVNTNSSIDELIHAGIDVFIVKENANVLFDYFYKYVADGLMGE